MKFPDFVRAGGTPIGAPEDFPSGSIERAKVLAIYLLLSWDLESTTWPEWHAEVRRVKREAVHTRLGFPTFDAFLQALLGKSEAEARARFATALTEPSIKTSTARPAKRLQRIQKELPQLTPDEVVELRQALEQLGG